MLPVVRRDGTSGARRGRYAKVGHMRVTRPAIDGMGTNVSKARTAVQEWNMIATVPQGYSTAISRPKYHNKGGWRCCQAPSRET